MAVPVIQLLDWGGLLKSAFVTGTRVIYNTSDGRQVRGQVVGPDQTYFPSPIEVFVSFPSTGLTLLVPVTKLEVVNT